MVKISFTTDAGYTASEELIVSGLRDFFRENGVDYDATVSVMVASEDRVMKLAMKYMGENEHEAKGHPVLSFCEDETESEFIYPNTKSKYLGEIVVSYEFAKHQAFRENRDISEVMLEWASHGALHLLGIHHD